MSANQSKAIWSVIDELLDKKKKANKIKKVKISKDQHTSQPHEIAETFNTYFSNIGRQLASNIPDVPHRIYSPRVACSFQLFDTSTDEVTKLISQLNPRKGNRVNDKPTSVIKISNHIISPFLCDIYNTCIFGVQGEGGPTAIFCFFVFLLLLLPPDDDFFLNAVDELPQPVLFCSCNAEVRFCITELRS